MRSKILQRSAYVIFAFFLFGSTQLFSQSPKGAKPISSANRQLSKVAMEKLVREYILKNPEIIRDALASLEAKERNEKSTRSAENLRSKQNEIFGTAGDPVAGNPDGDVSVAVFFDYTCGYCRKTLPELTAILAKDSSLRIVYKEFPILSDQSETAALAALAAARQGKYVAFHDALIGAHTINDEEIRSIAGRLGLNYEILRKDMKDPKLAATLAKNSELANALDINGTPAYIIGDQIIPGAIDAESLKKLIQTHRANARHSGSMAPVAANR